MTGQGSPHRAFRRPAKEPPQRPAATRARSVRQRGDGWLWGRHAVAAALANPARRWRRLAILPGLEGEAAALVAAACALHRGTAEPVAAIDRAALNLLVPEEI